MEKTDLAVAIAGFLILGVAVAGAAVLEEGAAESRAFVVAWAKDSRALEPVTRTFSGSGSADASFPAVEQNLTKVIVHVTVTHAGPRVPNGADVSVTVSGPDNFTGSTSGALPAGAGAGSLELDVPIMIQDPPAVATVDGASATEARGALLADHVSRLGLGDWVVGVNVQDGSLSQGAFTVTLAFSYETYRATVSEPAAPVTR